MAGRPTPQPGKRSSPKGGPKVEVTYFHKPADRAKTVPQLEVPAPRVTPSERRAAQDRKRGSAGSGGSGGSGAAGKGRRRTTAELPAVDPAAKTEREFPAVQLDDDGHVPGGARNKAGKPMGPQQVAELALFGHHLFESGRIAEARVVFEGLVELAVEDAFPHTMLGIIYLSESRNDRALALFEAALTLDPDDQAARVYRAEIRLGRGRVKQALEDLGKVLAGAGGPGSGDAPNPFAERARKLMASAMGAPSGRKKRK